MRYFKQLKEKCAVTIEEEAEIRSLSDFVRRIDDTMGFGNYNEVSMETVLEANAAQKRIREIQQNIKKRRRNALFGK